MIKYIIFLLIPFCVCGQKNSSEILTFKLDSIYNKSEFPGFAVAIVNKDSTLYQNGFGYSNFDDKTPYSVHTVQNIASLSKTFIAVALMKSIEKNLLSLETPINDILPYNISNSK